MAATEKTGTHTWAEQEASIENAKTSAAMLTAIGMTADQVSALSGANAPSGTNVVATMADIPDVPEIPSQANMPTSDQKAALTGTSGTPSASNPYTTKATTDAEASARTSGDALALKIASNLSDLNNATTARTNLGLGTAAVTESTAYATAAQGALADSAVQPAAIVDQTFAAAVSTNPYSATPALTPRRIGDRAYNTTSLEWWDGIATAGATTSWQLSASGGSGSGDMTRAVYDTANRGYVDRAVLADTATTAGTISGSITMSQVSDAGSAATKAVGTTTGTVAAGDDSRIVAGGTALQPTGNGASLTGITAAQVGLGNVDNTSDANKPVSTAQATAITAQVFAAVALTNPYSATTPLTPRYLGDIAINSTSLEIWVSNSTTGATGSWEVAAQGPYGGTLVTDVHSITRNGFYSAVSTASNLPTTDESYYLSALCSNLSTTSAVITAVGLTSGKMWMKRKVSSTWGAWVGGVTSQELAHVIGVTSPIQTQADAKLAKASNLSDLTDVGVARGSIGLRYLPQDNLLPDKGRFAGVLANPYSITTPYTAYTASTISVIGSTFTLHSSVAGFNVTTFAVGKLVNILGCTNAGNNIQVIVAAVTTSDITFSGDVSTMVDESAGASITLRAHTYVAGMAFMHPYTAVTEAIVGKIIYNNTTYGGTQGALSSSANNWVTSANSLVPMYTRYVPERGVIRYTVGGTTDAYHIVTYNHSSLLFGIGNYASWSGWLRLVSGTAEFGYLTGGLSSVDGASYTSGSKTLSSDGNFHFYRVVQKPSLPYDNAFPGIRAYGGSLIELVCPAFYNGWVPAESIEVNPIIGSAPWDGVTL